MPPLLHPTDEDLAKLVDAHAPIEWGYGPLTRQPYVTCACGWESSAAPRWWQDVCEELDEHIARMKMLA